MTGSEKTSGSGDGTAPAVSPPRRVGFVGLGQMGAPMAARLAAGAQTGETVLAYDREPSARARALAAGAPVVDAPAALRALDALILCLPDGAAVSDALFGAPLTEALAPGGVVVDVSTIDVAAAQRIAARLAAGGHAFIDAPVTGMRARAEEGALTMICGGDGTRIDALRPQLGRMASEIVHLGDVGSGQLGKLINQLLLNINAAAVAEVLPFAVSLGLDPEKMSEVVNSGTGRSFVSEFFLPRILRGAFDEGYPLAAAYKDMIGAAELAARTASPTPVLAAATATYQQALRRGYGDLDKGAMIRVYEELLGVQVRRKHAIPAED